MESYKISIIVPVYNVEQYLRQCMDSLVNQTLEEIEIIAVNDGSPDGSLAILEEYQKAYPKKVKVFSIENQGVSHAFPNQQANICCLWTAMIILSGRLVSFCTQRRREMRMTWFFLRGTTNKTEYARKISHCHGTRILN